MARALTAAMLAEIVKKTVSPILLFEGEFDGGTIHLWSGVGTISWNGNTYTGAGQLLSVAPVEETVEVRAVGVQIGLSGLPASLVSLALSSARQGKKGRVWLGFIEPGIVDFDFTKATLAANIGQGLATIAVTRASATATRVNAAGLIETVAADTARFDYDPVTLLCKGLLIEEARTNNYLRSAEFDNAAWIKSTVTVTADQAVAPDGAMAMDRIDHPGGAGHINQSVAVSAGQTWTKSVYAKAGSLSNIYFELNDGGSFFVPAFNLSTGVATPASGVTVSMVALPGGVYRCTATRTWTNNGFLGTTYIGAYGASSAGNLYLWGAQGEPGGAPTSYIPTTSTTVTRNADQPTIASLGSWFNAAASTYFAEWQGLPGASGNAGNSRIIGLTGAGSKTPLSYNSSPGPSIQPGAWDGTTALNYPNGNYTTGTIGRMACAFTETTDRALSFNGFAVATDAGANYGTPTAMYIGHSAGSLQLNGHIRRFTYYPRRLVDADLQAMSAGGKDPALVGERIIADPYLIFTGLLDVPTMSETGETADIAISYENRLVGLLTANDRRYTPEDQHVDFPGDTGFDYVAGLQDAKIVW